MLEFNGFTSHVLTLVCAVHNKRSGQVHAMPYHTSAKSMVPVHAK